ncbi:hypothetical protein B0H13DRAFT_2331745 [Mycena leptocephala]|nr:hypothetical protein B0H13DRAFT_2331745 [Mycena leptocephala]
MCRYSVERDYCKTCRRWRPEERWSKLADCNLETCRHSDIHRRRVHHFRRAIFVALVGNHRNLVVHLGFRAVSVYARSAHRVHLLLVRIRSPVVPSPAIPSPNHVKNKPYSPGLLIPRSHRPSCLLRLATHRDRLLRHLLPCLDHHQRRSAPTCPPFSLRAPPTTPPLPVDNHPPPLQRERLSYREVQRAPPPAYVAVCADHSSSSSPPCALRPDSAPLSPTARVNTAALFTSCCPPLLPFPPRAPPRRTVVSSCAPLCLLKDHPHRSMRGLGCILKPRTPPPTCLAPAASIRHRSRCVLLLPAQDDHLYSATPSGRSPHPFPITYPHFSPARPAATVTRAVSTPLAPHDCDARSASSPHLDCRSLWGILPLRSKCAAACSRYAYAPRGTASASPIVLEQAFAHRIRLHASRFSIILLYHQSS